MDILLWLVPAALVTAVTMVWVGWLGREGRGQVDREVAVRRLGEALADPGSDRRSARRRRPGPGYAAPAPERDRSTGVAVRPSRAGSPEREPGDDAGPVSRVS